jgi:nucleosome binding factor SPN SPT16 subunit
LRSGVVWNGADCLLLHRGPLNDDEIYLKSTLLHQWTFGYELPDSVLLLRKDGQVWFFATKKKCDFLRPAVDASPPEKSSIRQIHLLVRNKGDNGDDENYNTLWNESLEARTNGEKRTVGVIMKEREDNLSGGGLLGKWEEKLTASTETEGVTLVDVAPGLAFAMSVKDETELDIMKKSSVLANKVMKHGYVKKMEEVIDSEEPISHEALATYVEEILEDPSKISLKVPKEDVQSCYTPIIQSGGKYDLRVSAQSNEDNLTNDVIIVSIGARYKQYCSNITRTFFVDPPKKVSETYEILLGLQDACLAAMKPGNQLKEVYNAAVTYLKDEQSSKYLVQHLPKVLGFCTGLDFRESQMVLSSKNQATFKKGMVFCLSVGFQDLELSTSERAGLSDKSPVRRQCAVLL